MNKQDNRKSPTQPIDQQKSFTRKMQANWYIPNANYWVDICLGNEDKAWVRKFFNAANGLVDADTYDYVIKNYVDHVDTDGKALGDKGKLYGELRDVDFLTPIKEKYMGEFINAYSEFQVYNNDPNIVLARNQAVSDKIMTWINQEVINRLNERGMDTNQPSIPQEELEGVIEQFLENWSDDVAVKANQRLQLVNSINNAVRVYEECYFNYWATEECYTYREIVEGEVKFMDINPMEYYRLDSGNVMVEDDDAGCRRFQMSIPQIIDEHRHRLTKKEIDYLQFIYTARYGYDPNQGMQWLRNLEDFAERQFDTKVLRETLKKEFSDIRDKIWCYHYVFKTKVKQGILVYYDELGMPNEAIVDETYKLDKSKGDIEIKWEWVNQVWQGWRFGDRAGGVYTKPEPVPFQRELVNNNSVVKLPYNGISGLAKNNIKNPIPYRVLPYLALYRIYTLQQERAIAKFKSWITIPESILADSPDMTMEERMIAANKDGIYPFNDDAVNVNSLQAIREVSNKTLIDYIRVLEELKDGLKASAWEAAHYNSARAGETKDYGTKAVNEYNYQQAVTGNSWLTQRFFHFMSKDYLANIDATKIAWIDGKQGSYIDPSSGKVQIVDLDGESDACSNLGVWFKRNSRTQQQLQQMQEFAFNLGQNGEYEAALNAIMSESALEIKRSTDKALKATRAYNLEMQKAEQEAQQQIQAMANENAQAEREFLAEQKQLDRESAERIKIIEGDKKIELEQLRWGVDTDRNGYVDKDEAAAARGGYNASTANAVKVNQALNKQ